MSLVPEPWREFDPLLPRRAALTVVENRFGPVDVPRACPLDQIAFPDAHQPRRWE